MLTGLFVYTHCDLALSDTWRLKLTRSFRHNDTRSRPFGIGMTQDYEMFIWSALQFQEMDLILPDGGRVHYVRTSPGTGYTKNAEFDKAHQYTYALLQIARQVGSRRWRLGRHIGRWHNLLLRRTTADAVDARPLRQSHNAYSHTGEFREHHPDPRSQRALPLNSLTMLPITSPRRRTTWDVRWRTSMTSWAV